MGRDEQQRGLIWHVHVWMQWMAHDWGKEMSALLDLFVCMLPAACLLFACSLHTVSICHHSNASKHEAQLVNGLTKARGDGCSRSAKEQLAIACIMRADPQWNMRACGVHCRHLVKQSIVSS